MKHTIVKVNLNDYEQNIDARDLILNGKKEVAPFWPVERPRQDYPNNSRMHILGKDADGVGLDNLIVGYQLPLTTNVSVKDNKYHAATVTKNPDLGNAVLLDGDQQGVIAQRTEDMSRVLEEVIEAVPYSTTDAQGSRKFYDGLVGQLQRSEIGRGKGGKRVATIRVNMDEQGFCHAYLTPTSMLTDGALNYLQAMANVAAKYAQGTIKKEDLNVLIERTVPIKQNQIVSVPRFLREGDEIVDIRPNTTYKHYFTKDGKNHVVPLNHPVNKNAIIGDIAMINADSQGRILYDHKHIVRDVVIRNEGKNPMEAFLKPGNKLVFDDSLKTNMIAGTAGTQEKEDSVVEMDVYLTSSEPAAPTASTTGTPGYTTPVVASPSATPAPAGAPSFVIAQPLPIQPQTPGAIPAPSATPAPVAPPLPIQPQTLGAPQTS